MKCAVIAFPGNNCETETARAAAKNGFDSQIFRWNQLEDFKAFNPDFIILPGGFSFEDRGRSGVLSSKEEIFDEIREFAKQGKIVLGICNGAQMIVESALIPAEVALAKNVRRNEEGHVLGTGFFNDWVYLTPERKDTAFTKFLDKKVLHVPIAHGEGRFVSRDGETENKLEDGALVALRYSTEQGEVSAKFPVTPNGSDFAVAAICNAEGTIMAMMPHPERFFDSCDGDAVFQSVAKFIEAGLAPTEVVIGDFAHLPIPKIHEFKKDKNKLYLEKKLIITDNECFSVKSGAEKICGEDIDLARTILFEISGDNLDEEKIIDSGLILNPAKEFLIEKNDNSKKKLAVSEYEDDEADHLSDKLTELFGNETKVKIYKVWSFGTETSDDVLGKIVQARLLANPNSGEVFEI